MQFLEVNQSKIPFIFEENTDLPIVILRLVFRNCGRSYDKIAGTAKIFARILNEGVDDKFFKDLEFKAINLEANSGFESLEINLSCLKENFNFALSSLEKLFLKPRIEEKILEKLKINALGELASKNSDFDYLAKKLLNQELFEYEEFQSPNDGNEKSISTISLKDLRDFYEKHINLSSLVVVLGGDLQEQKAKEYMLKFLVKLPVGKLNIQKTYELSKVIKDKILVRKESEQAYIYFATPFFANLEDKDLYLAKIALFVLGQGGFGSRIMEEIRVKRGLAYSAYAMLDMNMSFSRIFGYLQTKNESAKEAKQIVKEVFENFIKQGISQNELDQAKNFLIGSTPLRYESLSKRLIMAFSEFYQGLNLGYYKTELKLIENVDLEQINAYIKKHQELLNISFASIQNEN
ncbi:insulinase family protein [Campylobacter hepaticus]|uniref:M16 family metallopeptidase n=1 Tax=Campylobacter hepaticus TaxID=1813019 RepID=UPI0018C05AE2|nr:pitrilysin family protein [Campylobacter hepaticus]MCZ0772710.1 insulinase family protein [Campylobacter hepaticus]MCZ0774178.1 insulinase family protein [Campylobacter hepaticus]MCZ0775430.1 insulinase family protein [Campylobacter hepaticus]MDX2323812.1 pitrilysin family protein [Campylobacter hepaticus]MDX2333141.1 pitrilysin family protein [Campylobacter hepaticus]